jgi:MFS family permease
LVDRPGCFLANVAVLLFSWLSGDQFLVWGWRIPFLISIVMVGVGLWIRLGITETPVFQKVLAEERVEASDHLARRRASSRRAGLRTTAQLRLSNAVSATSLGCRLSTCQTGTLLGRAR